MKTLKTIGRASFAVLFLGMAASNSTFLSMLDGTRSMLETHVRASAQDEIDGEIWRYTGTPCNGRSCLGWQLLDNNPNTRLVGSGSRLGCVVRKRYLPQNSNTSRFCKRAVVILPSVLFCCSLPKFRLTLNFRSFPSVSTTSRRSRAVNGS